MSRSRIRSGTAIAAVVIAGSLVAPDASAGSVVGARFAGDSVTISYFLQAGVGQTKSDGSTPDATSFTEFDQELDETLNGDEGRTRGKASNRTTILLGPGNPQEEQVVLESVRSVGSISGSARGPGDAARARTESELIVGFEVQGQPVPFSIDGFVTANNSDGENCTTARVLLEANDPIFERKETAGGDCDPESSIGDTTGVLPPDQYDLEISLLGGVENETGAQSYSGSYNVSLTLFPACTHSGEELGGPINGSSGDDVICGGPGNDTIAAGEGNDVVLGNGGEDDIEGGPGTDELFGGAGKDTISGVGADFGVVTGSKGDFIDGGPGDDLIAGSSDDDFILGGVGLDTIEGGIGDDLIDGGPGEPPGQSNARELLIGMCLGCDASDLGPDESDNDTISGDEGPDRVLAGPGRDKVFGGDGSDQLLGQEGNEIDTLGGGQIDAAILGGPGKDLINGGPGDDFGEGGEGQDDLTGGPGVDKLFGQGGGDDIAGGPKKDVLDGGSENDSIHSRDCLRDTVRGGAGNHDQAQVDNRDEVSGVEGSVGLRC